MHTKSWVLRVSAVLPFNVWYGNMLKKTNVLDILCAQILLTFFTFSMILLNLPLDPKLDSATGPLATADWVSNCVLSLWDGCPNPHKRHPSWPGCAAGTHNGSRINARSCLYPAGDCPPMCAECCSRHLSHLQIHHARDVLFCI